MTVSANSSGELEAAKRFSNTPYSEANDRCQRSRPSKSRQNKSPLPKNTKICSPSVTGEGLAMLLLVSWYSVGAVPHRRVCHSGWPLSRSRQMTCNSCCRGPSELVQTMRSPQTIGFEMPEPGNAAFQATPSLADQRTGARPVVGDAIARGAPPAGPVPGCSRCRQQQPGHDAAKSGHRRGRRSVVHGDFSAAGSSSDRSGKPRPLASQNRNCSDQLFGTCGSMCCGP